MVNNHPVFICQHSVGIKPFCSDSLKKMGFTKSKVWAKPHYKAWSSGEGILGLGEVGTISWRRLDHLEESIQSSNILPLEQPQHTEISSRKTKKICSQRNAGKVFKLLPGVIAAATTRPTSRRIEAPSLNKSCLPGLLSYVEEKPREQLAFFIFSFAK